LRRGLDAVKLQQEVLVLLPQLAQADSSLAVHGVVPFWLVASDSEGRALAADSDQLAQQRCMVVDYLWACSDAVAGAGRLAQRIVRTLGLERRRPHLA
jgi:hypothetical protein